MSIFLPLTLLILIATGWLSFLSTELVVLKSKLIFWFLIISCFSFLPSLVILTSLEVQLQYVVLLYLFFVMMSQIPLYRLFTVVSLMLTLGSILFLYHEVAHIQTTWFSPAFQWFAVLFSTAEAIIVTTVLRERICLLFGGFLTTQCAVIYLHHDQLSPILFPGEGFLGLLWLSFFVLLLVHWLSVVAVPYWRRNGRFILWTKKR